MAVVRLNEQQLMLVEKILEKLDHVGEILDRMEQRMQQNSKRMQESFLLGEDQTAEESVKKTVEVEERVVMSTKVVPNETPKEIPIYVVLRNPEPILISIFSDGQPQPSFPSVSLRNNHVLPSFSSVILSSNYAVTEEGPTFKMDRGIRWEFDPGGVYFLYLYYFSSHPDSLIQPLILALNFAYAKVVGSILDCTFSLFSLKLIHTEIYRPRPSRSNTPSVYTMIDCVCRSTGLREEAIKLDVLCGLLSTIRSPRVLIPCFMWVTPVLQVFDIFGACYATIVFIPSFHNYRIWFFLGLGMTTSTAWYLTIAIQGMHGCANFVPNMLDKMRRRIFCAGRGAPKGPMIIGGLHYMFKQNFEDDQSLVSILRSSKQITIILSDCLTEMRETLCYEIYLNNSWAVFNMSDGLLERVLHPENVIFSILIVVMIKDGEDLYTMSCVDTEAEANSGLQVVGTLISAPQLFLILPLRDVMRWEGINLLKIWKYHWIKKQILWPFDRGKGKDVVEMLSARFTFVFSTLETKVFARERIDEGGNLQCSYHSWSFNGCGSSVAKTVAAKGGVSAIMFKSQVAICVVLTNSKNRISLSFKHCKEI